MFKTWATSARDQRDLARAVEVHLNEYAQEIISVAYAVAHDHYALIVYRPIDMEQSAEVDTMVAVAEQIIDDYQG